MSQAPDNPAPHHSSSSFHSQLQMKNLSNCNATTYQAPSYLNLVFLESRAWDKSLRVTQRSWIERQEDPSRKSRRDNTQMNSQLDKDMRNVLLNMGLSEGLLEIFLWNILLKKERGTCLFIQSSHIGKIFAAQTINLLNSRLYVHEF